MIGIGLAYSLYVIGKNTLIGREITTSSFGSSTIGASVSYTHLDVYKRQVYELRECFGEHEEFLRQYLDDTFRENYSTLARYMYHIRFYTILIYPREYFLTLQDEVDPSLSDIFNRPERSAGKIEKRFSHDWINIWYYFRYRITLMISWISKRFGMFISNIYFSRRDSGRITQENLKKIIPKMKPGDIICLLYTSRCV